MVKYFPYTLPCEFYGLNLQKVAQAQELVLHLVMIGDLRLMLLPTALLTRIPMEITLDPHPMATVDITVIQHRTAM